MFTPEGHGEGDWVPFVVVWGDERFEPALRAAGFAGVFAAADWDGKRLRDAMVRVRQRVRIDQGAAHALVAANPQEAAAALLAQRCEFQSVTVVGAAAHVATPSWQKLRFRRVEELDSAEVADAVARVRAAHARRALTGAAAQVARALDSFHDAAAVADERRYFAILPDDAVFLGTDATERWTGEQFRAFATPYFERPSAWTYVPLQRHVTVDEHGALAWFDELLDNAHYGECRGSGVLQRRGDAWVLRQYNLTVPVPNELMGDVAQRVRAFCDGEAPAVTTFVFAEASPRTDAALADVELAGRYASQPAGEARPMPDGGLDVALRTLRRVHHGETVLVHPALDELPALLAAAGVAAPAPKNCADRLLVVTYGVGGARVLTVRLGDESGDQRR